jgi:hypothetical protein
VRVFGWLLLHRALPCGAAKVPFFPVGAAGLADIACCGHAACRPGSVPSAAGTATQDGRRAGVCAADDGDGWQLETLQHALLDCPAVRPALQWLAALWAQMTGGPAPPLTAAVWLQGSPSAWRPGPARDGGGRQWLWGVLRLSLLAEAWRLRCRRRRVAGEQFGPGDIVAALLAVVRRLLLADWQRVGSDVASVAGICPGWLPDRRPAMSALAFEERWCLGGVFARLHPGGGAAAPRLELRLHGLGLARPSGAGPGGRGGGV